MWGWFLCVAAAAVLSSVQGAGAGAARLVCYVESARATDGFSECTHLVYAGDARGDKLDALLKEYRKNNPRLKILLRIAEVDKDLRKLLKSKHVQGLEIHDAHKALNKTKVSETVDAARAALTSSGGGPLFLALPAHPELLAKYYDLRTLVKKADLMMVQTHALGMVKKMTYHPSRLSGLWDMMNTDSVVDLVVGLGIPASKVVISLPATVRQFSLANETLSTPGSPTVEDDPKEVDQAELCRQLQKGRWTLERDQDLSAPYAFKDKTWMSFEDASSVDVKGKYARVRGLAGLALHAADRDAESSCGPSLKASLAKVLNQQSRAPRAAVLRSLEHEILSAPSNARALDALQVSPYRITQVVDSDGVIHSIREDTRTEFSCSRQGYFVHPRSCARFYRCVKFDQLSSEYTVFEFDCPAGLAFDSRYEVCVWPGSLPHSQACPGSSEIAPVPKTRFICPEHEGYYADPENCRWFFACLDHGKAPLTAYEFRCPFGLGFDADKLKCDWPWLVPACGNIARYEAEAFGYSGASLTGAAGFYGQTADSVNVAAHQSLVSGASLNNLVGIQNGFLSNDDALDTNFIASQELANGAFSGADQSSQVEHGAGLSQGGNGLAYQVDAGSLNANLGLVQATKYDQPKYSSGSIILDDYRLPTKPVGRGSQNIGVGVGAISQAGYTKYSTASGQKIAQYQRASYDDDNSGAYVHDPSGDYAEPYKHIGSPDVPYVHADAGYKHTGDYYDAGSYSGSSQGYSGSSQGYSGSSQGYSGSSQGYSGSSQSYSGSSQSGYEGKYASRNEGQYVHDNSGAYLESVSSGSGYKGDNSGAYVETGSTGNGYKGDYSGSYNADFSGSNNADYSGSYKADNSGSYNVDNSGSYNADFSGSYNDNSGKYEAGVYRTDGHIGSSVGAGISSQTTSADNTQFGSYSTANAGNYLSDSKAYTGSSHTLTAGAVNVGLVGKTTLVDADYNDQRNYQAGLNANSYSQTHQTLHPGHVSYISQPAVSINHVGTDFNNLDGYSFVTTPTSSGIPTTATPFAVTTALPAVSTYKTQFVPEAPKSSIKQIFGYTQPAVTYVQPTVVAVKEQYTPNIQVSSYNQGSNYQSGSSYSNNNGGISASQDSGKTESGYHYSKPSIKFQDGVTYTTAAPVVSVSTYKPQGFGHSQQTLHKVESVGFQYSTPTPVTEEPFKRVVAYTTGPSVTTFAQPTVSTYSPQAFSHQTIHKVESGNVYSSDAGANFEYNAGVSFEQPKNVVQYTTSQPAIVSTYQPQVFSHQTLHQVDAGKVNTYSDASSGYDYSKPAVKFEEAVKTVQYSTPAPVVSTYRPQAYSHQTLHKVEIQKTGPIFSTAVPKVEFNYQAPVSVYQNPIVEYTQKATPVTYVQSTYRPKAYSQQTIHKVEDTKVYKPSIDFGSAGYSTSGVTYEQPQTVVQYTTAQPAIAVQPAVSTYQPQAYSHQTIHKVDASQVNAYSQGSESGYDYSKPAVNFEEVGKTVFEYSTPAPVVSTYRPQVAKTVFEYSTAKPAVVSTYRPQSYSSQTIHKVESQKFVPVSSTPQPISTYENPILKYTKNVTPVTYVKPTAAIYTQTYQPLVQQHQVSHVVSQPIQYEGTAQQSYEQNVQLNQEGYSQPEIQRNIEANSAKTYSDASLVSHQFYHQSNENHYDSGKDVVFVSTSPSTLAYEDHYVDYESPKKVETYKAPEYIPPKTRYQQTYSVSTASTPIVQQSSVFHQANDEYDYKPGEYSQQFDTVQNTVPVQQVSFSKSHVSEPKRVESVHFSSLPATTYTTNYKQAYQSPEIQVGYQAEEYLPPVVSTVTPIVSSTYRPRTYSTVSSTREYLPPSTTARPIVKSTTPSYKYAEPTYKAEEYLPPVELNGPSVVNFESFGLDNTDATAAPKIRYNPYQDYSVPKDNSAYITQTVAPLKRKQNIVVETAKSHLLGFGTVGPDAGLVSPVTYTTGAPVIVSSTYRPIVKSTAQTPLYFQSTTEYKAPEYLPPLGESDQVLNFKTVESQVQYNPYQDNTVVVSTSAPIHRKQNIVVETAKSHLLGFGTAGPDAGLVSPVTYTTAAPTFISSTNSYSLSPKTVTSTYAPVEQGLFEVTPSSVPVRRTKPKVAVVTKINDFNPLLVRKLGAVCSCQSPVLVLKGRRPNVQSQKDFDDYSSNDYDYSNRGDINDNQWAQKTANLRNSVVNAVTTSPVVTSTFNPIIVPDDSYYQDYQEPSNVDVIVTPKNNVYSGNYVSSTPVYSSTERLVRVRPRVKAVTAAPTYKTVLLKQEVAPTVVVQESESAVSGIDSHAFDRYGPGGLRSRDETLQGSVDCQRAGLFRHPKQCNKFYACRWDCTKQRFTLHVFNCPVQLSFDPSIGACNWPSQGPACQGDTLLTNAL